MEIRKKIALVGHDNRKQELVEWAEHNWKLLVQQDLICTGTTGRLIEVALNKKIHENGSDRILNILKLKSGPLGGDQQLGAMISERKVDVMIFFWDPMQPQPHDVDVKALLRISVLYNVVVADNRATADFVITSNLFREKYNNHVSDFAEYTNRKL
ncbi:MAG TPA: methylglyoxal synthase [Bacteroidales bacterium]|jgi:methylglyoxal synthase|nr:methylglyoxal synthase [Bacteroidales bacterium]